jgi:hypothetical protein
MILRSIKPISATDQLTPLDTDHVSLHPYQPFRLAINLFKMHIYDASKRRLQSHQPPLDHSHSLYQPRDSHHTLALRLFTLFYQPNQQHQPAHASHHSFTFYRLINDKMRTSLTFLTLLAAAGSAVAAPVPASNMGNGAVQKIVSGHHRRSDSQIMVDLKEHMVSQSMRHIPGFTKI